MRNINGMFFDFPFVKRKGDNFMLSAGCVIKTAENCYAVSYIKKILQGLSEDGISKEIVLQVGIPEAVIKDIGDRYCKNEEGYVLVIDEKISIYGQSKKALKYGVVTLHQLIQANAVSEMILFDYPDKPIRGYRIFTPGKSDFEDFKRVLDMLVYYKYNSIIIEVGGAMEYKRHPEINTKWVEFCEEVHKGPRESARIQRETHPQWSKNSIHADNGGGGFITQDEMREVVAWCRERELEIIPEVPSLSHSDYILRAHPELNERKEDTYPDTYCPSNPKSYEILFDILDEVIEIFKPKIINIGHDEVYTLAKCERCKGKAPVDLYVGDITKISNYLQERNIATLMWCEKMFGDATKYNYARPVGGAAKPEKDVPALYECKGRIPKDVLLLNWYWSICDMAEEQDILNMGYKMIYGNFNVLLCKDYRRRITQVGGGFVSNWGSMKEEYMQRNGQNYSLISSAFVFWNSEFDTDSNAYVHEKLKKELYRRYKEQIGEYTIEVLHTTDKDIKSVPFYDGYFIVNDEWILGNYYVTYKDGSRTKLPVIYGYNIDTWTKVDSVEGLGRKEIMGAAIPVEFNGKTYYKTAYVNPYPEKEIDSVKFCKEGAYDPDSYQVIWFAEQGYSAGKQMDSTREIDLVAEGLE